MVFMLTYLMIYGNIIFLLVCGITDVTNSYSLKLKKFLFLAFLSL